METNRRIEISRQIYARLLYLYPEKHRSEYGADMLQVFTDQCRSVQRSGAWLGFIALWVRTLIDLAVNVFREQLIAAHSSQGLLESVPNAPLPWKGVALVLIPGIIFFVSQVAQLTGEDWFFLMVYRAGYFMILPVLIVWAWKRKFPIWGLMPLGLLFKTLLDRISWLNNEIGTTNFSNPLLRWLVPVFNAFPIGPRTRDILIVSVLLLVLLVLLWLGIRRGALSRGAWAWFGIFMLLVVLDIFANANQCIDCNFLSVSGEETQTLLENMVYYDVYFYGGFLVLILFGVQLARRHGRLAALLPLGYLLPATIYGRISNEWPNPGTPEFVFMVSVSIAVLVFRFLVAVAGPLWIVRSATVSMQSRASGISLGALIGIQAVFNLFLMFYGGWGGDLLNNSYFMISGKLIIGAGVAFALVLYRQAPAAGTRDNIVPAGSSVS
jgi:hypothetical protein